MPEHPNTSAAVSRQVSRPPAEQNITRAMNTCQWPRLPLSVQCNAPSPTPRPATRRRAAEPSRPNAQRQQRPDSDRLDPGMCKERRPRATAQRCACRQLGNATEGRRSQSPQMPARCHQRSPRRPVPRLQRGCEGRLLNARAPNLRLRRRGRRPCRAPSTLGTFDETRKHDRTCRIADVLQQRILMSHGPWRPSAHAALEQVSGEHVVQLIVTLIERHRADPGRCARWLQARWFSAS
jgi:hypothetical protein